ncbi:hypothetical protein PSPO01_11425 [Paraphaeosphaeria sporulosa]
MFVEFATVRHASRETLVSPAERRRISAGFSVGARGRAASVAWQCIDVVGEGIVDVVVANHPRSVVLHNPISWSEGETERLMPLMSCASWRRM